MLLQRPERFLAVARFVHGVPGSLQGLNDRVQDKFLLIFEIPSFFVAKDICSYILGFV